MANARIIVFIFTEHRPFSSIQNNHCSKLMLAVDPITTLEEYHWELQTIQVRTTMEIDGGYDEKQDICDSEDEK